MTVSQLSVPDFVAEQLVRMALVEDLGAGDVTTDACVLPDATAIAHARARTDLVVAGVELAYAAFRLVDPNVTFEVVAGNGSSVSAGGDVFVVRGNARAILNAERVALNFLQRACGIATTTRVYVEARAPGSLTRITDTRKTTPGLRAVERAAVRAGGGHNHRNDLSSAVLIKDNHILAAGGIRPAIERARALAPHTSRIECEVDDLNGLNDALEAGADIVLLDNMNDAQVAEAVFATKSRALLEVSGGITIERIASLSALGVHAISVGALTHSVRSADIGLDFEVPPVVNA
jgi:nicotinate-nucleotide pyrophosphorylase (carboxylating)